MPIQVPQWTEFLSCPVCYKTFSLHQHEPISLACGHTICKECLDKLHQKKCPFDQNPVTRDVDELPANYALLQLVDSEEIPKDEGFLDQVPDILPENLKFYQSSINCIKEVALYLKPVSAVGDNVSQSGCIISRPLQRKLVTLVNCQLIEEEGRTRAMRSIRSLGERIVTELILLHQNPQRLSANLWAAVRARGCQFLGPGMQEEVLKLILLALEDGSALSRKILVLFVVQRLEIHYPHASKTAIGHVVQLLYRASCFMVTKREEESSLMQLKEDFRTYESLRREHDSQIVQIALEAGMRIAPDQWSSLLYGDTTHKSHMQSIIDKLQTPQSFSQSVSELVIALQRSGDTCNLQRLKLHFEFLANIDPNSDAPSPSWENLEAVLKAGNMAMQGLVDFINKNGGQKKAELMTPHSARYKTSICRDLTQKGTCPRGVNCTYAHSNEEMERYRSRPTNTNGTCPDIQSVHDAPVSVKNELSVTKVQSIPSEDNVENSWNDNKAKANPSVSEQVGPIHSVAKVELCQTPGINSEMLMSKVSRPSRMISTPSSAYQNLHHSQPQMSTALQTPPVYPPPTGPRFSGATVLPVYQQTYSLPQTPQQCPTIPYMLSSQDIHRLPYHPHSNYVPRISNYQDAWKPNSQYIGFHDQPAMTPNIGADLYYPGPRAPSPMVSQGSLVKLQQHRNELLAQLLRHKSGPNQNRKVTSMAPVTIQENVTRNLWRSAIDVQLAKSVTDMLVASRTMTSLFDTMENTQEKSVPPADFNTGFCDDDLGLGSIFSDKTDSCTDEIFPNYLPFRPINKPDPGVFPKPTETFESEPDIYNMSDNTHVECGTCHSRIMWKQKQDGSLFFPDMLRDEDENFIPFDPPLVSRFGPISRSARSKYKTSDPVQVTADMVLKCLTPVTSVTPITRPYPSSAPAPSRYPDPSFHQFDGPIVPPYKTDPVLVNPLSLPEIQQYLPIRRKEQTKQEVLDLQKRAQTAETEDQRLTLELQAVELQISMKTGKTPEMVTRCRNMIFSD